MIGQISEFSIGFLASTFSITLVGMLGILIFLSNSKSLTHKVFFWLSIVVSLWSLFNFLYNQPNIGDIALWFLRIHMSLSVWYAFLIFLFFYIIFIDNIIPKYIKFYLSTLTLIISIIALTPLMFEKIIYFSPSGEIGNVKTNPITSVFGFFVISLFITSSIVSLKKILEKPFDFKNKIHYILISLGFIITFLLHIIFNFIFPNIYHITKYTIISPFFTLAFVVLIGLAIFKYKFLNIRIFTSVIFITILIVLTIFQLMSGGPGIRLIINFLIFISVFVFGIILIRNIYREIEQKEQLEKLNKELDHLNKIKSEFLSIASHQIRSPMVNIRGFVDLLIHGTYGELPQEVITTLKKIEKNIQTEIDLVNNLLDLRKIEEGRMEYEFINFDLTPEVRNICEFYSIKAKEKNLNLQCDMPLSILIKGDKEKIVQVINNLIDNALKYTDQGFVEVKVQDLKNKVLISVKDSGRGIKKENLEKIFEAFSRGQEVKKEILGTGLGLYIAKNIIDAHQGKIWAESEGLGKGSTFYIELPKNIDH